MALDATRFLAIASSALVGAASLTGAVSPAWAATRVTLREGTNLAVSADHLGERMSFSLMGQVWVADTGNGIASALTAPGSGNPRPALSPDGQQIAFEAFIDGHHQIMLLSAAGGEPRQLTFGDYQHHSPSWHPDGRRLVMSSDRGGDYGIWEIDLETLGLRQLSFLPGDERDAAYNRRGDRLAFIQHIGNSEKLLIREANGRVTGLFSETAGQLHGPAWRPDDSLISFTFRSAGISELRMAILSDPPVVKPLTRGENVFPFAAQWIDRDSFIYAADGRIRRRAFDAFKSVDLPFTASVNLLERPAGDAPDHACRARLPAARLAA
jgi:dipeptidyl aminopeptidase/acylaminoacyl peptidase